MIENIKCVTGAPSVQMQEVPPDFMCLESLEDQEDPDGRHDDESRSVKEPKGRGGIDQVGQEERVKEGEKSRGWEIEEGGGGGRMDRRDIEGSLCWISFALGVLNVIPNHVVYKPYF